MLLSRLAPALMVLVSLSAAETSVTFANKPVGQLRARRGENIIQVSIVDGAENLVLELRENVELTRRLQVRFAHPANSFIFGTFGGFASSSLCVRVTRRKS